MATETKGFVDYYAALGQPFGASDAALKAAYRAIARKLHPDSYIETGGLAKEDEDRMREEFTKATEAYDVLRDPAEKEKYDLLYIEEQKRLQRIKEAEEAAAQAAKEAQAQAEKEAKEKAAREAAAHARKGQEAERDDKRESGKGNDYQEARRDKARQQSQKSYKKEKYKPRHMQEKESIVDEIKRAYSEIKEEESKWTFSQRHQKADEVFGFYDEEEDAYEVTDLIKVELKRGIVHLSLELFYQLYKLSYINKDTPTKFVIRNRRTFAAVILAGTILSGAAHQTPDQSTSAIDADVVFTPPTPMTQMSEENIEENITLTRIYKVRFGDCLSTLAYESHSSVEEIKRLNDLKSNTIYADSTLRIPYHISMDDLSLYTQAVPVGDKTLSEIAEEYQTDVKTIIKLNKESIEQINTGVYVILSDNLIVPKYISRSEYNDIKNTHAYS